MCAIVISWQLVQSVFAVKRLAELWQRWKRQMNQQLPVLPDFQGFKECASMYGYYRKLISSTGRSMKLRLHQQLHTSIYNWSLFTLFYLRKYRYMYVAYWQLTRWCWGSLGRNIRMMLPACAVKKIRDIYITDSYTGFNFPTLE